MTAGFGITYEGRGCHVLTCWLTSVALVSFIILGLWGLTFTSQARVNVLALPLWGASRYITENRKTRLCQSTGLSLLERTVPAQIFASHRHTSTSSARVVADRGRGVINPQAMTESGCCGILCKQDPRSMSSFPPAGEWPGYCIYRWHSSKAETMLPLHQFLSEFRSGLVRHLSEFLRRFEAPE